MHNRAVSRRSVARLHFFHALPRCSGVALTVGQDEEHVRVYALRRAGRPSESTTAHRQRFRSAIVRRSSLQLLLGQLDNLLIVTIRNNNACRSKGQLLRDGTAFSRNRIPLNVLPSRPRSDGFAMQPD